VGDGGVGREPDPFIDVGIIGGVSGRSLLEEVSIVSGFFQIHGHFL
jgi:hypothetical protein